MAKSRIIIIISAIIILGIIAIFGAVGRKVKEGAILFPKVEEATSVPSEVVPGSPTGITEPKGEELTPVVQPSEGTKQEGSLGGVFAIKPVDWNNPDSPMASAPLKESDIPKEAIRLEISPVGFSPNVFTVKAGQKVILSIYSNDSLTHVFKFKDASLSEVAVGVSAGETRAITFYAPQKVGEYNFFCEMPSHEIRGEKGKMLVK